MIVEEEKLSTLGGLNLEQIKCVCGHLAFQNMSEIAWVLFTPGRLSSALLHGFSTRKQCLLASTELDCPVGPHITLPDPSAQKVISILFYNGRITLCAHCLSCQTKHMRWEWANEIAVCPFRKVRAWSSGLLGTAGFRGCGPLTVFLSSRPLYCSLESVESREKTKSSWPKQHKRILSVKTQFISKLWKHWK